VCRRWSRVEDRREVSDSESFSECSALKILSCCRIHNAREWNFQRSENAFLVRLGWSFNLISFGKTRLLSRRCQALTDQPRQTFNLFALMKTLGESTGSYNTVTICFATNSTCIGFKRLHAFVKLGKTWLEYVQGRADQGGLWRFLVFYSVALSSQMRHGNCHSLMLYLYNECLGIRNLCVVFLVQAVLSLLQQEPAHTFTSTSATPFPSTKIVSI